MVTGMGGSSSIGSAADLSQQVALAVAVKSRQISKAQGEAVLSLLNAAAELQVQSNTQDKRIGSLVDVKA